MKSEARAMAHELAKDSIVTDALAQFISQVIEELHKTRIAPAEARAERAEAKCDALREALKRLLGAAVLLAGQAEGCIVSHHSEDHAVHGLPGWYLDCVADIAAARRIINGDPLCDCERGHNGIGLAGRECDCRRARALTQEQPDVGE